MFALTSLEVACKEYRTKANMNKNPTSLHPTSAAGRRDSLSILKIFGGEDIFLLNKERQNTSGVQDTALITQRRKNWSCNQIFPHFAANKHVLQGSGGQFLKPKPIIFAKNK